MTAPDYVALAIALGLTLRWAQRRRAESRRGGLVPHYDVASAWRRGRR